VHRRMIQLMVCNIYLYYTPIPVDTTTLDTRAVAHMETLMSTAADVGRALGTLVSSVTENDDDEITHSDEE
jgi:hypothetical protein